MKKQDKELVLTIVVGRNFKSRQFPETGLTMFIFMKDENKIWDWVTTDTIEDAMERMNRIYDRKFKYILDGKVVE